MEITALVTCVVDLGKFWGMVYTRYVCVKSTCGFEWRVCRYTRFCKSESWVCYRGRGKRSFFLLLPHMYCRRVWQKQALLTNQSCHFLAAVDGNGRRSSCH